MFSGPIAEIRNRKNDSNEGALLKRQNAVEGPIKNLSRAMTQEEYRVLIREASTDQVNKTAPITPAGQNTVIDGGCITEDDDRTVTKSVKEQLEPTPSDLVKKRRRCRNTASLDQELTGLRITRQDPEIRLFKKRQQEATEMSKKYFPVEVEQPDIPELTDQMVETVNAIWKGGNNNLIRETARGHECRRADAQTLIGRTWLNDEVINFYFGLMLDRADQADSLPSIHAFSTFFYPKVAKQGHSGVKRWTRKVDLFSKDRVLFPIHLGVHWTLAAAIMDKKEIVYLDSMGDGNPTCREKLLEYLETEHQLRKKAPLPEGWTTRSLSHEIPQQNNSSDCGVFCCKFGDYIARGLLEFNFTAHDMPTFRKAITYEIATGELL